LTLTDQIKNRVVGTIVIFALAIIFLPDILDGKKQQSAVDFVTIPVKPNQVSTTVSQPPMISDSEQLATELTLAKTAQANLALQQTKTPTSETKPNSETDVKTATNTAAITAEPELEAQPQPKVTIVLAKPVSNSADKATPVVETSSVPKPKAVSWRKKKEAQPTNAWVITVGTFKEASNVRSLLVKLRSKGFTAFSVPAKPRQGDISKVYVGPSTNKAQLAKLQPKLKAAINEAGYISAYNPTEK